MKRLIRFVACLYPASWRARYGVEFEALLEDLDPNWRTFLDTLKGGLDMQVSTWKTGKLLAATGIAGILIGLCVSLTVPRQYASTATIRIVVLAFSRCARHRRIRRQLCEWHCLPSHEPILADEDH